MLQDKEIFKLAQLMEEAGFDFYFNGDDYADFVPDDDFEYTIVTQTGELIGAMDPITVFQKEDGLSLLDMRPAAGKASPTAEDGKLYENLTAEEAMDIMEKFFNGLWP